MPFNPAAFDEEESKPAASSGFDPANFDEPKKGDAALGVAKQFGAGIAEGATPQHLLGSWVNKSDPLAGENLTSLPAPKPSDYANAARNALPEAQGPAERIARSAGSAIPMAASLGAPSPMNLGISVGLGAVGQGAEEVAPGTGPYAALGAGALGLATGRGISNIRRMLKEYKGAPDLDALKESVNNRWGDARSLGWKGNPTEVSNELGNIKQNIDVHPENAPKTFGFLNRAEAEHAPLSQSQGVTAEQRAGLAPLPEKEPVTFDKLDSLRRDLQDVAQQGGPESRAASQAIHGLHDFLARQPGEIGNMAKLAREETAAMKRLTAMDGIREKARINGGTDRDFRNALNTFIRPAISGKNKGKSPAMREGFTDAEINEMKEMSHASTHNLLRWFGNIFGASHAGWFGPIGAVMGHPMLFASSMFGKTLQGLSSVVARARFDRLNRMTASRSPLAREMGVQGRIEKRPLASSLTRAAPIIAGGALGPTSQQFKQGGRVKRSFNWQMRAEGGVVNENYDYDMDAFKQDNPNAVIGPGVHYPDTYKKPNHPTFSDESKYHGQNGAQGGHWTQNTDDSYTFAPGATNLQNFTPQQLQDYFSKVEPGNYLDFSGMQK